MSGPPGMEDPISAIFDLSDRVADMVPVVRRMYRYTATILVIWVVLMAFVALLTFGANPYVSVLAALGLVAGAIGLSLLRRTDRFFRTFAQRHRSIRLLRDADPVVRIPEGRTPVERFARYLALSNPRVESLLSDAPSSARYRASLGAHGRTVPFDLVIEQRSSGSARWFGVGDPGFAILARLGSATPTVGDLMQLESDTQAAALGLAAAPARIILLRTTGGPLAEEVYDYAVGHPVFVRWGTRRVRLNLEIISENADGTYDFVPHVLGMP
ncbi:MAG: hypothetical protein L3K14_04405 [Thermoplasmata archaeon]|nr:hypothetical protein [Thermoplasmata archaeon]